MWLFSKSCGSKARLVGKTVIITGGSTGIGKETARDLYRRGARVILACKDVIEAEEAVEELKTNPPSRPEREQFNGEPGELVICKLNLSNFGSVRQCAKILTKTEPNIHVLINNAGLMMCPHERTDDGNEMQLQCNHLGHFLLTLLLLPKLKSSAPGTRIINVSSEAHRREKITDLINTQTLFWLIIMDTFSEGHIHFDDLNLEKSYHPIKAYCQSKLANILFTRELARRIEDAKIDGITVYTLHPGVVSTDLWRHVDTAMFPGIGLLFNVFVKPLIKSPELGAQTTIHCAVDEKAGRETGLYYDECVATTPSPEARDKDTAIRLWNESVKIVGLETQVNLAEKLTMLSRIVDSLPIHEKENPQSALHRSIPTK